MNPIESVLLENINKPDSLFVFPTDTAASRWADHLLRLKGDGTAAMNKFIAWDMFKQNSIRSKVQNKKSIPSALRKIFTSRLVSENAQAIEQGKTPIFSSLIRTQWASQSAQFAPWLTGILPQLGSWFGKTTGLSADSILSESGEKATSKFEGDDRDMYVLALRYAQFLNAHDLFEPAWETPPFNDEGKECFIFFPESISDYGEYRELLAASSHVKTIGSCGAENLPADAFFYANSRSEITEAALYIRALNEKQGINWDSIVVCISDSQNYEPYVLREFTNRNIPFVKRSSKPLTDYPAGRFFRSVLDCESRDFAFSSVVSLIMNRNLPWKNSENINKLIQFGINNNCLYSWVEGTDGKERHVNVWEDAFKQPLGGIDSDTRQFFTDLKRRIHALRGGSSFSEVRRQYFNFREQFFDMDKCSEETNLILSRCIAELTDLCELEKDFPDVNALDPFSFLTEFLSEVYYLAQTRDAGVVILPYKTAAAAPFDCHIILGAGQENLSVVYTHLDFLPRKKREALGIFDEDASAAFINMHKFNSLKTAAFFCSEQTFSGFTIAHSKIGAPSKPRENYTTDPVLGEKFSKDYYRAESSFDSSQPIKLHENQINGFTEWKTRRKQTNEICENPALNKTLDFIQKKLTKHGKFPQKYSVSASSLKAYYQCSLYWLFDHILGLDNVQIEASLMEENLSGTVYHAALNLIFAELKEKKEPLSKPIYSDQGPALPPSYRRLLQDCVDRIFDGFPSILAGEETIERIQMSSLTARFLRVGKKHFLFNLENFFAHFLSLFSGCRVKGCETSYQAERDTFFLSGKLDCILEDSGGNYIIVDFKLKTLPDRDDCTGDGDNGLCDFQLPMYMTLAEENEKIEIKTALFFSILNFIPRVIIGTVQDAQNEKIFPEKEKDRILHNSEMYKKIFEEFDKKACQFANEISTGKFTVFEQDSKECYKCKYNRICRKVYTIKYEEKISLGNY
jgi:hypothetical protein